MNLIYLYIIYYSNGILLHNMKYSIAIAALLGLTTQVQETQAITLWTNRGTIAYEESESDDELVQL